jgi:hypothetical protein
MKKGVLSQSDLMRSGMFIQTVTTVFSSNEILTISKVNKQSHCTSAVHLTMLSAPIKIEL